MDLDCYAAAMQFDTPLVNIEVDTQNGVRMKCNQSDSGAK